MKSVLPRLLALLILFPILFQLGSLVVVGPVMLFKLATGRALLESSVAISLAQFTVGLAVATWASRALWRRMSDGEAASGEGLTD